MFLSPTLYVAFHLVSSVSGTRNANVSQKRTFVTIFNPFSVFPKRITGAMGVKEADIQEKRSRVVL